VDFGVGQRASHCEVGRNQFESGLVFPERMQSVRTGHSDRYDNEQVDVEESDV